MIIEEIKKAGSYGLLIDEVTDIAVTEQLIIFVQFWNSTSGGTDGIEVTFRKFVCVFVCLDQIFIAVPPALILKLSI